MSKKQAIVLLLILFVGGGGAFVLAYNGHAGFGALAFVVTIGVFCYWPLGRKEK